MLMIMDVSIVILWVCNLYEDGVL